MKLHYYPETDSLYIEFKPTPGTETREVVGGLNVDLDADGEVVGFDIDHASKLVDLSTLEAESLPLVGIGSRIGGSDIQTFPTPGKADSGSGG